MSVQYAFEDAGILTKDGRLTEEAILHSEICSLKGGVIANRSIVNVLTRDGSNIHDWAKFTTQSIKLPSGQSRQIHFYKNLKTGAIDYDTVDFKVKYPVSLDKFLK